MRFDPTQTAKELREMPKVSINAALRGTAEQAVRAVAGKRMQKITDGIGDTPENIKAMQDFLGSKKGYEDFKDVYSVESLKSAIQSYSR